MEKKDWNSWNAIWTFFHGVKQMYVNKCRKEKQGIEKWEVEEVIL